MAFSLSLPIGMIDHQKLAYDYGKNASERLVQRFEHQKLQRTLRQFEKQIASGIPTYYTQCAPYENYLLAKQSFANDE